MDVLEDLGSRLDGELLTPGDFRYDDARRPGIARFRHVRPRAVVRCATVRDVVRTIAFARAPRDVDATLTLLNP